MSNERKMQIIEKDGQTFLSTAEKENHINSVRKWEQAFCIYATIYSTANPSCAGEI